MVEEWWFCGGGMVERVPRNGQMVESLWEEWWLLFMGKEWEGSLWG